MKQWKVTLVINGHYSETIVFATNQSQAWQVARAQYGSNVRNVVEA